MRTKVLCGLSAAQQPHSSTQRNCATRAKIKYSSGVINKPAHFLPLASRRLIQNVKEMKAVKLLGLSSQTKLSWSAKVREESGKQKRSDSQNPKLKIWILPPRCQQGWKKTSKTNLIKLFHMSCTTWRPWTGKVYAHKQVISLWLDQWCWLKYLQPWLNSVLWPEYSDGEKICAIPVL